MQTWCFFVVRLQTFYLSENNPYYTLFFKLKKVGISRRKVRKW